MKKLAFIITFCLSVSAFLKAQENGLALVEKPLTFIAESKNLTDLTVYCGVYKMTENPYIEEVKLTVKNGQLMSKTPDDEDITLKAVDEDVFFIREFSARVIFTREKGIIKSVKVVAHGKEIVGEKL